jgi:hypothetical protein
MRQSNHWNHLIAALVAVLSISVPSFSQSTNQRLRNRQMAEQRVQEMKKTFSTYFARGTVAYWFVTSDGCGNEWRKQQEQSDPCWQIVNEIDRQVKVKQLGWEALPKDIGYRCGRVIDESMPLSDYWCDSLLAAGIEYLVIFHGYGVAESEDKVSKIAIVVMQGVFNGPLAAGIGAARAANAQDISVYGTVYDIRNRQMDISLKACSEYTGDSSERSITAKSFSVLVDKCNEKLRGSKEPSIRQRH